MPQPQSRTETLDITSEQSVDSAVHRWANSDTLPDISIQRSVLNLCRYKRKKNSDHDSVSSSL